VTELKYPEWQEPLQAALLEFNAQRLSVKIQKAEEEIGKRISELGLKNTEEESRLLHDSLFLIRQLKGQADQLL
jgi:hypothetical protein